MKQAICFLMFKRFSKRGQFGWIENCSAKESSSFICKNKRLAVCVSDIFVCYPAKGTFSQKTYLPSKYNDIVYIFNLEYFSV